MNFTPVSQSQGAVDPYPTGTAPASGASKETFLQLLVAQIKHQNPLNPADGTQFLTQLAQFSELEQMVAIRDEVSALRQQVEAQAAETAASGETAPEAATEETAGDNNV